jgi:hypothetical protein
MDTEALSSLIDTAVSGHEMQLSQILDDGEDEGEEGNPCNGDFIHPAAQRLAGKFNVAYESVIGWFCDGYGIGEIMLALKTAESTGENPGDLLILKTESGGWGEVWQERGLHGKPEDAGPPDDRPGKPEDAGPPDDVPGNPEDDEDDEDGGTPCDGDFTHPAVESLAEDFNIAYDIVIGWFCDGYGIGDIKLALETAEKTGAAPGDLLAQKTELGGWGEVWQEWGLIGKPDGAGPPDDRPGKPDDAGPPDNVP